MMQQMHTSWADPSIMGGLPSHRMATPQFATHNGTGGGGHMSGQQPYANVAAGAGGPTMLRRNNSATQGTPSWLQGGSFPARVPSANMDLFASTGGSVGSWGLSQSAEMLSISEDNAEQYQHVAAAAYAVNPSRVVALRPPLVFPLEI